MKDFIGKLNLVYLFPGILITSELLTLDILKIHNQQNEFFKTAFLLVFCYSLGLIGNVISRLLIDLISEKTTRVFFLKKIAHVTLDSAIKKFEKEYKDEIGKVDKSEDKIKTATKWNCIYRAAISRTHEDSEIKKRRVQGRYIRNLLIPLIIANFIIFPDLNGWQLAISITISVLTLLLLYSYSELSIFSEANDIVKTK